MAKYAYAFLYGEMVKQQMTVEQVSEKLGIQGRTFRNKLNGITDFTWSEVCTLHKLFPQFSKEELFQTVPNTEIQPVKNSA